MGQEISRKIPAKFPAEFPSPKSKKKSLTSFCRSARRTFTWQECAHTHARQMTHMPSLKVLKPLSLLCENEGSLRHRRVICSSQRKTYPPPHLGPPPHFKSARILTKQNPPFVRRTQEGCGGLGGEYPAALPQVRANFPAAVFLAGKCPNLGRDSISRCRKIGESFSSSVEICRKTFPAGNFGQPQPSRVF